MRACAAFAAVLACASATAAAQSSCDAAHAFSYDFTNQPDQQLSYGGRYNWSASNGVGQTQPFTLFFATYGTASTVVANMQMPQLSTIINDGAPASGHNLVIGMVLSGRTTNIGANSQVVVTTILFPTPIREFSVQVNDIDFYSDQYRDWLRITGSGGGVGYLPAITTPFGTDNAAGTKSAAGSTLLLGPSTSPFTVARQDALGTGANANNANNGTLTASFAQPVTRIQLRYGNSGLSPGGQATGQQGYGIQRFTWCAMPQLSVTKSSAPLATTGVDRFSVPGADMVYSITLENRGGSDVDLATVSAADALPANVSFFNGSFDGTSASPFALTVAGGAVVSGGTLSYSSDGVSYGYTPAAGYDPNVRAIRFSGSGVVPPGGSVVLRFRARIN